jgi:two-component system, chemotaxis family, chemotaxis protein CheY
MREQVTALEVGSVGARAAPAAHGVPRLLVIDDNNLHRLIICRVAAKVGYVTVEAPGYEEAATLMGEGEFDCITLDLSLGAHAGVEMLRHLWKIGCKTPIIIISGCDPAVAQETARFAKSLQLTVRESVPKPVDLGLLRYSLERRVSGGRPPPRPASSGTTPPDYFVSAS